MKKNNSIRLGTIIIAGIIVLLSACEEKDKFLKSSTGSGNIEESTNAKNESRDAAIQIEEYTYYENLIVTYDEDNWYTITTSADSLVITCDFIYSSGDINLELVDKDGNVLATSTGKNDHEMIIHIAPILDTYYIRVYLRSGTRNTYTLWWDDIWSGSIEETQSYPSTSIENNNSLETAASIIEYHHYNGLTISDTEDNWYAISTSADSLVITCDFIHSEGDINIELVDKDGVVLASSSSETDHEEIIYITSRLDTYYIRVYMESGTASSYTLWWDDIWSGTVEEPNSYPTGDMEDNHTQETATAIIEYHYYYDLTITDNEDNWYLISLSADSLIITCGFLHADGDINMELVDINGNVLVSSTGTTDHEVIIYIATILDVYYIHVFMASGTSSSYTLWWDDIWQGE